MKAFIEEKQSGRRLPAVTAISVSIILLSVVSAVGDWESDGVRSEIIIENETAMIENPAQSVTMRIDVEENDVVDLKMGRGDVVVDTWDGEDVLVIVEKNKAASKPSVERSLNIKVTRDGNNVHIATLDNSGRVFTDPNLSFRVFVPRRVQPNNDVNNIYDLSKLTSVVFRALHREALNWITR